MTKEQAINKIQKTPYVYLNDDQKKIAIGIINSIPKGQDVLAYFDFIMKRADVGFKFDVAPEIATGRIAVVNEMKEHNINTDPKTVDIDENKLIIGDNYEALKNLLLTHKEKIDVIYIDPPYNTEKSKEDGNTSSKEGNASKFIYKDKFGRNGWLNMMRDRLVLAKRLLSPEGVIFISIDDSEQAYLKVLMDEIFGEDNFEANLTWRRRHNQPNDKSKMIANVSDYILVYSKNSKLLKKRKSFFGDDLSEKAKKSYTNPDNDPLGTWATTPWKTSKNQGGSVYSIEFPDGTIHKEEWMGTQENFKDLVSNNKIHWPNNGSGFPRKKVYLSERILDGQPAINFLNWDTHGSNQEGSAQYDEIFTNQSKSKRFSYPKPTKLINKLIKLKVKGWNDYDEDKTNDLLHAFSKYKEQNENSKVKLLVCYSGKFNGSIKKPEVQFLEEGKIKSISIRKMLRLFFQ